MQLIPFIPCHCLRRWRIVLYVKPAVSCYRFPQFLPLLPPARSDSRFWLSKGNASEHASAIIFAMKNRMDLSIGIALGSSAQISMFLVPLCVLLAAPMGQPLDLDLGPFETASLLTAGLLLVFLAQDGRSNALRGLTMVSAYLVFAAACYAHIDPRLEAEQEGGGGAAEMLGFPPPPPPPGPLR
jgi:hypothetical protein